MILHAHGLGGLRDLIAYVRARPLTSCAVKPAPLSIAAIDFDRDLDAPSATLVLTIPIKTWSSILHARVVSLALLHESAGAALTARLRAFAERVREVPRV